MMGETAMQRRHRVADGVSDAGDYIRQYSYRPPCAVLLLAGTGSAALASSFYGAITQTLKLDRDPTSQFVQVNRGV
jgi:hypothetical protein